jgi:hypothetical protein
MAPGARRRFLALCPVRTRFANLAHFCTPKLGELSQLRSRKCQQTGATAPKCVGTDLALVPIEPRMDEQLVAAPTTERGLTMTRQDKDDNRQNLRQKIAQLAQELMRQDSNLTQLEAWNKAQFIISEETILKRN